MRPVHFAALLSLLLLTTPGVAVHAQDFPATTLSVGQRAVYVEAVEFFREQRFSAAYGRFARLADAGHAPSAQVALLMYVNGPALFSNDWYATPDQQRHWNALVANTARGVGPSWTMSGGD